MYKKTHHDIYPILPSFAKTALMTGRQYQERYQQSCDDPETFWGEQAKKYLTWFASWEKVLSRGPDLFNARWFAGGKLNVAYNCLDRHLDTKADQVAMLWEGNSPEESAKFTYAELHEKVCRFANVLKQYGITKGDRVCIYLPMVPEAAIAMLACTRIGAIHSVVFAGFSADALRARVLDADCKIVITANEGLRGNKIIPLKQNVDLALQACPHVKQVIVVKRNDHPVEWNKARDIEYEQAMAKVGPDCAAEIMDALDPLFILYTSGSTGSPKGILHGTGGYLLYAAMTHQLVFDYHENEVHWCTADVGWITGHSYTIYGPLANGATTLLFEGAPSYPTFSRFWEIVDKYRVNIFYTAPTAIRSLRREGEKWVKCTDRSSLRILGSVGEPINPEAWEWYYHVVGEGRCPIVDTWWQTETGGIMISPLPGATPLKAGSAAWPFFGVVPKILDEEGKEAPDNQMGKLVITSPWPGMLQTVYNDPDRFIKTYFQDPPGYYATGDQAYRDAEGYFWILGRSDDVLKISGHRIGTQEVESALITHSAVSEAAVVAKKDEIKGNSIYAFVTLKAGVSGTDELKTELVQTVRNTIGAMAAPQTIQWADALPKTRSGKIMRRLLGKIANQNFSDMGDTSTLAEPNVLDDLIEQAKSGTVGNKK